MDPADPDRPDAERPGSTPPAGDPAAAPAAGGPAAGNPAAAWASGDQNDTQFIVSQAQRDEQRAWVQLSGKVLFFLRGRFGNVSFPPGMEFDDFASEVMLKLLGDIAKFQDQGKDSFWGWVYMLSQNRLNDLWRRYNREQQLGLVGRGETNETGVVRLDDRHDPDAESVSEIMCIREIEAAERDCAARLPTDMRNVYFMRRQQDLSFAAISAAMNGIKEVTLRSHYKRARDFIKDCIRQKIDALGGRFEHWR
ncbi:MAG: RNA polymerase sigma factor [Planctomycetota bacterium]